MKILNLRLAILAVVICLLLNGCSDSFSPVTIPGITYNVWQNPFMSPNPTNNVHCDSYMTDSYSFAGPNLSVQPQISQVNVATIKDPYTGNERVITLGECAAQAFDAQGNIQTVSAGISGPNATSVERFIVTIDRNTLKILALYSFQKPLHNTGGVDFGGAGYFYQDNQYRMVVALPDGHVKILRRTPSAVGGIDGYTADADYDVIGTIGAVPLPPGSTLDLYAVVPDKVGNIWFTTNHSIVGTITPGGVIHWFNINDPDNTGQLHAQPDGGFEEIANSHSIDQGDSSSEPSGVYIVTTYHMYRFVAGTDGKPSISWSAAYERVNSVKSGQVSAGSGTSPTIFNMGNRRFVTIADNAQFMNVNVYRAEANLQHGEERLFAQVKPFGQNASVSDENSLIVSPGSDGSSVNIYAENNFGNDDVNSTIGAAMTQPGFARMHLQNDGTFTVGSVNNSIAVPSLVSKISLGSNMVYTYNKTSDGWYLTGLDADNLANVRFTAKIGPGSLDYNNFYAALALDSDGKTIWLGTLFGLTKIQQSQ